MKLVSNVPSNPLGWNIADTSIENEYEFDDPTTGCDEVGLAEDELVDDADFGYTPGEDGPTRRRNEIQGFEGGDVFVDPRPARKSIGKHTEPTDSASRLKGWD